MSKNFNLEIDESINVIVDELPGNGGFLALRKLRWNNNSPFKLDIRRWFVNSDGEEIAGKGVSFITEEGPGNLVHALLTNGFCDTMRTLDSIKDRDDFLPCVKEILEQNHYDLNSVKRNSLDELDYNFYDPKDIL